MFLYDNERSLRKAKLFEISESLMLSEDELFVKLTKRNELDVIRGEKN